MSQRDQDPQEDEGCLLNLVKLIFGIAILVGGWPAVAWGINHGPEFIAELREEGPAWIDRFTATTTGEEPDDKKGNTPATTPTNDEIKLYPNPVQRHQPLKELMLRLTNEERQKAGAPPVHLGTNPAAQLHAEAALRGCYSSHWDQWGLKPNHRYTLTGGTGSDAENVSGSDYCIRISDNYESLGPMAEEVAETVTGWMNSPGHRRSLLDPAHTTLNVGIAHDRYNTVMGPTIRLRLRDLHHEAEYRRNRHTPSGSHGKKGNLQHTQFTKPPGLL